MRHFRLKRESRDRAIEAGKNRLRRWMNRRNFSEKCLVKAPTAKTPIIGGSGKTMRFRFLFGNWSRESTDCGCAGTSSLLNNKLPCSPPSWMVRFILIPASFASWLVKNTKSSILRFMIRLCSFVAEGWFTEASQNQVPAKAMTVSLTYEIGGFTKHENTDVWFLPGFVGTMFSVCNVGISNGWICMLHLSDVNGDENFDNVDILVTHFLPQFCEAMPYPHAMFFLSLLLWY